MPNMMTIDVGGTFVDLSVVRDGVLVLTRKIAKLENIEALISQEYTALLSTGSPVSSIDEIRYSTTLAINLLLERKGARLALLHTSGFSNILDTREELPYNLYDPFATFPEPLVGTEDRFAIRERIDGRGEVSTPLDDAQAIEMVDEIARKGYSAVAISLLNSHKNTDHEQRLAELVRQRCKDAVVTVSSDLLGQIGEYPRTSTAVTNAFIHPAIRQHLSRLDEALRQSGFEGDLYVVSSSGGIMELETALAYPVLLLESGPAAGAIAAAKLVGTEGLAFDVGGTTAKATFFTAEGPVLTRDYEVCRVEKFRKGSGFRVKVPTVDIIEVGAGGGSRITRHEGLFEIGPESEAAVPGPICFGAGGQEVTLTDVNALLGIVDPARLSSGGQTFDLEKAFCDRFDVEPNKVAETAHGIFNLANVRMATALRVYAAERGIDIRGHRMITLGGGGSIHGLEVARELGIASVTIPRATGVFSAIGCAAVAKRFQKSKSIRLPLAETSLDELRAATETLRQEVARKGRFAAGRSRSSVSLSMRVQGQYTAIEVDLRAHELVCLSEEQLRLEFAKRYRSVYKVDSGAAPVEICEITVRVESCDDSRLPDMSGNWEGGVRLTTRHRPVYLGRATGWQDVPVVTRDEIAADFTEGPCLVEDPDATILVPRGMRFRRSADGAIDVEVLRMSVPIDDSNLESDWTKLVSITDEAAVVLQNSAVSRIVNVARDFSCVLCDAQGRLLAQSLQGLPEFVNSLSESVTHFIDAIGRDNIREGDVYISNDPLICTSQVNDFVFVRPIYLEGRIIGFAANVSHSADVGGRLLSANAVDVFEEGIRIPVSYYMRNGHENADLLDILFKNSRTPVTMKGDFRAQLASCLVTEERLKEFCVKHGLGSIDDISERILHKTAEVVAAAIRTVPEGRYVGMTKMDGYDEDLQICCAITVNHAGPSVHFDLTGSSPQTDGSFNCYSNYIRAELMFSFLTLLRLGVDVNVASFRYFDFTFPERSVINAEFPAAVGARSLVVQYIVSAVYDAMGSQLPDSVPADPAAPIWPILISGKTYSGSTFVDLLFLNGGMGARPNGDGILIGFPAPVVSTQVEHMEDDLPILFLCKELDDSTRGKGRYLGGPGQKVALRTICGSRMKIIFRSERIRNGARGRNGGGTGACGLIKLNGGRLKGKETIFIGDGDLLEITTPGGGGHGPAATRPSHE